MSGHKFTIISKLFGANKIVQAVIQDKIKCFHLFQCFLEADNTNTVKTIGKFLINDAIDLSKSVLLPRDIHTFIFCLIRSTSKVWKTLNLSGCFIGDHGFNIFTKSFAECRNDKITIESVDISNNHLTSVSINGIISLIHCFKTERLHYTITAPTMNCLIINFLKILLMATKL